MERKSRVTTVFVVSAIITGLFTIWGLFPESLLGNASLLNVTSTLQGWLSNGMGWFYLLSATGFLLVAIFLIFSRYGSIRLGKDTDRPEFSYLSWFAMLFSAGMGIGLIFWERLNRCSTSTHHHSLHLHLKEMHGLLCVMHFSIGASIHGRFTQ